jgi:hypothetical protein
VPFQWIGRQVEVRETKDKVEIQYGSRQSVSHTRIIDPIGQRITLREHRPARGQGIKRSDPRPDVEALKKRGRMVREYPRAAFVSAP